MKKTNAWFSIIEILIGIFIFTLWLVGVYALILSTIQMNEYSKNSIIASNLARESIESVRNVRDSNYKNLFKWNKMPWENVANLFQTGVYYKIENDLYNTLHQNTLFTKIQDFGEGKSELNGKMKNYQLCLDEQKLYTYRCLSSHTPSSFYRYIVFDDVVYEENGEKKYLENALKLTSKVIWYNRGYHEVQLDTIITDFLRQ